MNSERLVIVPTAHPHAPSVVRVTDASGRLIAEIDPLTRVRRSVKGKVERTLTLQGFNAPSNGRNTPSWPGHGKAERRKG